MYIYISLWMCCNNVLADISLEDELEYVVSLLAGGYTPDTVVTELIDWYLDKANSDTSRRTSVRTNASRRRLNCGESYGWVVDSSEAQEAYEFACEYFGKENLDDQIVYSLGNDALSDCLAYIFRMNDFDEWEAYKNGEDY